MRPSLNILGLMTLDTGPALQAKKFERREIPPNEEGLDAGEQLRPQKEPGQDQAMGHGNPLRNRRSWNSKPRV
jgi:hypothetical protein